MFCNKSCFRNNNKSAFISSGSYTFSDINGYIRWNPSGNRYRTVLQVQVFQRRHRASCKNIAHKNKNA